MWKESYSVGVEIIDQQHKDLFKATDELLKAIDSEAEPEVFQKTIDFLKSYVVHHFRDEENYQASVNYCNLKEHQKLHQDFTNTIADYEQKLIQSNYDLKDVKDLAGLLTTWLIYHVADADQKITGNIPLITKHEACPYINNFSNNLIDVLQKMTGWDLKDAKENKTTSGKINGDIFVKVGLVGDVKGYAVFGFQKEVAFKFIEMMTFCEHNQIDELVCSALAEIANISSGNAATDLTTQGLCCDITTPVVYMEQEIIDESPEGIIIDTHIGGLEVVLVLE